MNRELMTCGVFVIASVAACHPHHQSAAPGYSNPPEQPPLEDNRTVVTRDLGPVAEGNCDVSALVAAAGAQCKSVPGQQATGSEPTTSANAFDSSACSVWNSGGNAPKFVAVDFGQLRTVTGVLLIPEMSPPVGEAKHVIESSDDGSTWKVAYVIEGQMATARAYSVPFQHPVTARYLRVTTEKSASWVAWREIVPLECGQAF